MSLGNKISISVQPLARKRWMLSSGITPKPGTVLQFKAATSPVAGQFTAELYDRDFHGNRPKGPLLILLEDDLQGRVSTDAYVSGDQLPVVTPYAGEEYNMLVANLTGSGSGAQDVVAIGDLWVPEDGTGKLISTASYGGTGIPEIEPFMSMEAVASLSADTHVWMIYTGY